MSGELAVNDGLKQEIKLMKNETRKHIDVEIGEVLKGWESDDFSLESV